MEAVPTIPGGHRAKRCSLPWRLFFFFLLLLCFLAPCGKLGFFFSFFLGREGFWARLGMFRFHGAIKEAAARPGQASEGRGGEGEEPGAAARSIQETGKVAPVITARLGFTHTAG